LCVSLCVCTNLCLYCVLLHECRSKAYAHRLLAVYRGACMRWQTPR
jgi:hypothetical protein